MEHRNNTTLQSPVALSGTVHSHSLRATILSIFPCVSWTSAKASVNERRTEKLDFYYWWSAKWKHLLILDILVKMRDKINLLRGANVEDHYVNTKLQESFFFFFVLTMILQYSFNVFVMCIKRELFAEHWNFPALCLQVVLLPKSDHCVYSDTPKDYITFHLLSDVHQKHNCPSAQC